MLSVDNLAKRVVGAEQQLKSIKASQLMNGDNSIFYPYSATTSGSVRNYVNVFEFDNDGNWFIFEAEGIFPLASISLRVWINGTEITSWTDYSVANFPRAYKKPSGGSYTNCYVSLESNNSRSKRPYSGRYPSVLQNPSTLGWGLSVYGNQMAVGTSMNFELSIRANQKGRLYVYDWSQG